MTELSLFTGIGGGCLASQHLLKHREMPKFRLWQQQHLGF